jgi:SAM-dependent methyltransferase
MDSEELNKVIDSNSQTIAFSIIEAAKSSSNEAEFRKIFQRIVENFAKQAGIELEVRDEYVLARGRADTVYNRLLIEYEPPGSLKGSNNYTNNKHAYGQLKTYIEDIDKRERRKKSRLLGVTTDGTWLIYVKFKEERKQPWEISEPQEINEYSVKKFLRSFASLVSGAALIPDNLERDFGTESLVARKCVEAFYKSLISTESEKVQVFFNQWKRHFNQVTGYSEASQHFNANDLAYLYGMKGSDFKLLPLFFAVHSYYATFIKLLALQIAGHYTFGGLPLKDFSGLESEKLLKEFNSLEEGGIFRDVGINNFLEGDFFSWYLDIWDEGIEKVVRGVIDKLSSYDPVTVEVDPELTRDLLKILYQQLVPKELRHDLGEYYTPDWLAERLLNQIQYNGNPDKRVLDPACGSGTFLILALKRIREYGRKKKISEKELLEKMLKNIAGIDLNPLAVISARTNFLMTISDLLPFMPKGGINIPVYLADSILTPSVQSDLFSQAYRVKTSVGEFDIPITIVENGQIDNLAELLESSVKRKETVKDFLAFYNERIKLNERDLEESKSAAELLYRKLVELEEKGINHIWARIIKNSFAPLFLSKFDYIIGNPPWINWENLPDDYRNSTKPLWESYGLFTLSGFAARMGGGKKDLSIIFTYVGVDRYLKDGGKLGFIITQTLFATVGAGDGFRRFQIDDKVFFRIIAVDDMVELKPFEGVGNRTAVFICQKGERTKYPVTYNYWKKRQKGTGMNMSLSLQEVGNIATYKQFFAVPIDNKKISSPWIVGRLKTLTAIRKLSGKSYYQARAGVCTWLNGAYWVKVLKKLPNGRFIVENTGEKGKIKVDSIKTEIEPNFVYPLVRGRDILRWEAQPKYSIVAPIDTKDNQNRNAYPEFLLKRDYPLTYRFFEKFKDKLSVRSGYRKYLEGQPFYSIYDVGVYTFAQFKVVYKGEVATDIIAAVISKHENQIIIPDQTAHFIPVSDELEAYFICAVMNSTLFRFGYKAMLYKHPSTFVFNFLRIPKYDKDQDLHLKIAQISHTISGSNLIDEQNGLDILISKIWGVTMSELEDIKTSLKEIS